MALNLSSSEITDEQLQQLDVIKVNHDEAYLYVSQGLSYQEKQEYSLARDMYSKGIEKINNALSVRCDRPYCKGCKWENAIKLQHKMRKTLIMIKTQLQEIDNIVNSNPLSNCLTNGNEINKPPQYKQTNSHSAASKQANGQIYPLLSEEASYVPPKPFEQPPSYDEACQHELVVSTKSSPASTMSDRKARRSTEVIELFAVQDEVVLFFVSKDGTVSTSTAQSSLHVYQFVDYSGGLSACPPAWLQIDSWTYPLVPGRSPVLESGYGAFLFPNIGAGEGSAVGVILPPSVDLVQRTTFLNILNSFGAFKDEKIVTQEGSVTNTSSGESFSDILSRGLVTGAEYLSAGIVKGAAISSDLIHKGASKARQKISPEDRVITVDPRVRDGIKIARDASGIVLKATGFLVKKLGDLTLSLGKQIAPHIKEQGTKLLSATLQTDKKKAGDTLDGVLTVAAGGLQGFSTVYMGLEEAARTLAYSLSSETVNIVGHKYGTEVGEVVGNALFSIGNLALTTHNVKSLGVKSVAKRTAKDAGKAVLVDYIDPEKKTMTVELKAKKQ